MIGADNAGLEAQGLGLQKNILADVPGFDHGMADARVAVFAGNPDKFA
jgi:hypothetical protein